MAGWTPSRREHNRDDNKSLPWSECCPDTIFGKGSGVVATGEYCSITGSRCVRILTMRSYSGHKSPPLCSNIQRALACHVVLPVLAVRRLFLGLFSSPAIPDWDGWPTWFWIYDKDTFENASKDNLRCLQCIEVPNNNNNNKISVLAFILFWGI